MNPTAIPLRLCLVFLGVLSAAMLVSPVYADSLAGVTVSVNSPTVTEGDMGSVTFTISNTSGKDLFSPGFGNLNNFPPTTTSGDPTDTIIPGSFLLAGNTCPSGFTLTNSSFLANNSTCMQTWTFATSNPPNDTDNNSGVQAVNFDFGYGTDCYTTTSDGGTTSIIVCTPGDNFGTITITVQDPVTPTPEPSSLFLLGSGLAALAALRRRLPSASPVARG